MTYNLQVLANHRNDLLLAEVAAWLHDMGKCADEHLTNQASNRPSGYSYQYKTAYSSLLAAAPSLSLLGETVSLRTLVEQAKPGAIHDMRQPWLLRALGRCHGAAHIEKEEADRAGKQPASDTRMSTAYGSERLPLSGLTTGLRALPYASIADRAIFLPAVQRTFSKALGETRRPENEVTLGDWSGLVAALYKAAVAGALLGYKPPPSDLRWRLLSVRVNSSAFLDHVTRMPDLLARQQLIQSGFDKVRIFLEETYPLGTEVYRDEDSSLYVVPDLAHLMNLTDQQGDCLESLIRQSFPQGTVNNDPSLAISGEIVPEVILDGASWWGQRPDRNSPPSQDVLPPISRVLQQPINANADIDTVAGWWSARRDICSVCSLRPQAAPDTKAGRRKVCEVCERRRDDRARAWVANFGASTIWLDEVADVNGRTVLLVGQFDLSEWIEGELVRTLTVNDPLRAPGGTSGDIGKNPSFSRLRRVWETTHQFWQEVLPTNPGQNLQQSLVVQVIGQGGLRLTIKGAIRYAEKAGTLGPFHAHELRLVNGMRLSVIWDPDRQRFVTIDNLGYIASMLGEQVPTKAEEESYTSYEKRVSLWAADRVGYHLLGELAIEEPSDFGAANTIRGEITVAPDGVGRIIDAQGEEIAYPPIIPILAEPRTFMALVPANRAVAVVQAIKAKYEHEMGKVRNRLPLTLGVVYAGRRTPLASLLDAGRRMLRRPAGAVQAEVQELTPQNPLPDGWPSALDVKLKIGERKIVVGVPTVMGDGTTPDVWYPYWQVTSKPTDCKRWFVGPDGEHWVHVCDLRKGDRVAFTPSTFDYEYLDASARRFEVAYGGDGQRMGQDRRQRPYLLEQVDDLEKTWDQISRLSLSQIKGLEALIEAKRRDWNEPIGTESVSNTFRQLVATALRESGIHDPALKTLKQAAITGMLADALEIHLTIHKDKPQ